MSGAAPAVFLPFLVSDVKCSVRVVESHRGLQHISFQEAGRSLQLAVSGVDVMQRVCLLTGAVVESGSLRARLSALQCLNDLYSSGHLNPRHFPPEPRAQRLAFVLQALDGWLAGATYREIATALFDRNRVDLDWGDPRGHLRDRVRRAVRRGRILMEGGYRQFLR